MTVLFSKPACSGSGSIPNIFDFQDGSFFVVCLTLPLCNKIILSSKLQISTFLLLTL